MGRCSTASRSRCGLPMSELQTVGKVSNRRGTKVRFKPDPLIFGPDAALKPARLFRMSRSKAYLFGGVEIRWRNEAAADGGVAREAVFHFPGGLKDYLAQDVAGKALVTDQVFTGKITKPAGHGSMEWAVAWLAADDGFGPFLLQHDPHARRRHSRGGAARGVAARLARACRARRPGQARLDPDRRRRDGLLCRADLGVLEGAGVPGPEQGPPDDGGGLAAGRGLRARRLRPLARRRTFTGGTAARLGGRARRGAPTSPRRGRMSHARARHGSCACRASSPIAPTIRHRAPSFSLSRVTRRAARPSRHATAPTRRFSLCAERS